MTGGFRAEVRAGLAAHVPAADEIWAQAWSEPDAGSDLAALRSRGVRVPGGWLVSGTKTWCSRAAFADRALLEASVRHASVREQFGRPVGTFQAVKHRLADVAIGLEFARPLLDAAALALDEEATAAGRDGPAAGRDGPAAGRDRPAAGRDGPAVRREVSAAKVACADAAYRAARAALQVHGAIGYTAEHELSRWLIQVRALVPAWGGPAEHRARVLRELG